MPGMKWNCVMLLPMNSARNGGPGLTGATGVAHDAAPRQATARAVTNRGVDLMSRSDDLDQVPGFAVGAEEHPVRLGVADERLRLRVPLQRAPEARGDVPDERHDGRAAPDL